MLFISRTTELLQLLSRIIENPIVPTLRKFLFELNDERVQIRIDELKPIKLETGAVTAVITLNNINKDVCKDDVDELILEIYKDNKRLYHVHHYDFERITRKLFTGLGYDVRPTKKTRDGGFDMVLQTDGVIPTTHLVECKSSNKGKSIGIKEARAFYSVVNERNACAGVMVTNTRFTFGVVEYAKNLLNRLILIDGSQLLDRIITHVNRFLFSSLTLAV